MNELITFEQWAAKRGIELVPDGENGAYTGEWFEQRNVPMVVRCTGCQMTMAIFSALIDEHDYTFCRGCAGDSGITADGDGHEGRSGHEQEAAGLDASEIGGAIGADGNVYSDADPGL